jgi:hypothetical protein
MSTPNQIKKVRRAALSSGTTLAVRARATPRSRQEMPPRVRGVITMPFMTGSVASPGARPSRPGGIVVGAIGLEPTTPTMSRWCSNQLSYAPATFNYTGSRLPRHACNNLAGDTRASGHQSLRARTRLAIVPKSDRHESPVLRRLRTDPAATRRSSVGPPNAIRHGREVEDDSL